MDSEAGWGFTQHYVATSYGNILLGPKALKWLRDASTDWEALWLAKGRRTKAQRLVKDRMAAILSALETLAEIEHNWGDSLRVIG